jgi:tetratricopeptide (TPR) repeat protein
MKGDVSSTRDYIQRIEDERPAAKEAIDLCVSLWVANCSPNRARLLRFLERANSTSAMPGANSGHCRSEINRVSPSSQPRKTRSAHSRGLSEKSSVVIQDMLATALAHHREGRKNEAALIYRQILALDAQQADSLHLLGMVAFQDGGHDTAVEMIRKAIAINQTDAAYHSNLGTIFQAQGKLEDAAACYRSALALSPQSAVANYNLASVLHAQEQLDDAAIYYEQALALQPDLAEAHYNLGNLFQTQEKFNEAATCYERALALEPNKYEALHNLGNAIQSLGRPQDAISCYERALAIQPGYAKAHYSLGCSLHILGNLDAALARYRLARDLQPDFAQAAFSESQAQLLQEDFASGWSNYESRWRISDHKTPMRNYPLPLWKGEKLDSGSLLIWPEQGVGDEIMFSALLLDAICTGNSCVLECDPRLKILFTRSFPYVDVISRLDASHDLSHKDRTGQVAEQPNPTKKEVTKKNPTQQDAKDQAFKLPHPGMEFAAHLPCGSLPGLFRKNYAAFVRRPPYLFSDPLVSRKFRNRYADGGKRLVGLAWHTNNRATGRSRSIDLSALSPLLSRSDIRWINLQYGNHDLIEEQAAAAGAPILIDRTVDQLSDLDTFAAQVAAMDLVVCIDNSTAHLAGALGVPVLLMLPFAPDWRWAQTGDNSLWYPTLRLFRQQQPGDWESVVQRVNSALKPGDLMPT